MNALTEYGFVKPTNLAARNAELAHEMGIKWPVIGKPGLPDNEKANTAYWVVLEGMYRYSLLAGLHGGKYGRAPYQNELNRAIDDTWEVNSQEWHQVRNAFADRNAHIGQKLIKWTDYKLEELKLEYLRVLELKEKVSDAADNATIVGAGTTAVSGASASSAAGKLVLSGATKANVAATIVSFGGLMATKYHLIDMIKELKGILKERMEKGEWTELEYYKFTSEHHE